MKYLVFIKSQKAHRKTGKLMSESAAVECWLTFLYKMALEELQAPVVIIQVFIHALHTRFITVYRHLRSTARSMCILQIQRDLCRPVYSGHLVDYY